MVMESQESATPAGTSINGTVAISKKQKEKDVIIPRQSLPRESKEKHKFMSESTTNKEKRKMLIFLCTNRHSEIIMNVRILLEHQRIQQIY